jgi:formate dehydrogenase major subunit
MVRLVIDGRPYDVSDGGTILDAVRAAGIRLTALCHDPRIAPSGACRLCLVRVGGTARPVTACTTAAREGMEISTSEADLVASRRRLLRMLARRLRSRARVPDESHPYIGVDMSRCIDCYRCVRICDELQGQSVWHVRGRGGATEIVADGPTLQESSCVSCGACADTCPTGAIHDRVATARPVPMRWTRTVCPYCGVGCELNVGARGDCIVAVRPVLDAPVSKGHLCVKGRYAHGFVAAPDRVTEPMLRGHDGWQAVSWDEAYAFVGARLRALVAQHGPDSVALLGSARATNEDNYVVQKFARVVLGTNNVDCCARVCHAPSAAALKRAVGAGLATNSFDDIERARTILVCGANATESHPVVGARIRQAARRGARLVVIDPRRIELAECADVHLAVRPGTNVPLLHAIAHTIVNEGLSDRTFVEARVSGFDEFVRFVEAWTPERAAAICGVDADAIRRAARLYAGEPPAMCVHGLGVTEHLQGTDGVTALINLALLTGNIGRPGGGVNPLRGQNNVQGASHMGCDPALLPGSAPLAGARAAFERHWCAPIPPAPGRRLLEMLDAAREGALKALWIVGYDVLPTSPDLAATAAALSALDLVIVQDMFMTETARAHADVSLPACSSFEKDGTFMNAERRIQRVRAVLPPRGASKPDWQIVCEAARVMGARGFDYTQPEAIWDEVRVLCDGARGMTYDRLDDGGLQWPCPSLDHPGTPMLHRDTFAGAPRAPLQCVPYVPHLAPLPPEYPFQLITGRTLYQFNAGTMTGRTRNAELRPMDLLDISPDDAAGLVEEGDRVRVVSEHGSAVLAVHVDARLQRGQLFATFHDPATGLNAVTGDVCDAVTGTPAYKVTAVRLEAT